MLEQRISNLEKSVVQMDAKLSAIELVLAEIKGQLSQFPKAMDFAALKADVAEIKGRIGNLPTTWTLMSFAVGACIASAGLAFTIARLIKP